MKIDLPRPSRPRGRKPLIALGVIVLLIVLFGGAVATLYTDVLWFRETGYSQVLWTGIWTRLGLGVAFGLAFAAVLGLNLLIARKLAKPSRLFSVPDQVLERYRATLQPYTKWVVLGLVLVMGVFAGSGAAVKWRDWLQFTNATDVGTTDPLFNRDLGFFLFRLPFLSFVYTWAFSSLVMVTLVTAGAHYILGGIRPQAAAGQRVASEVRAHLSVLLAVLVGLRAWGYRLDQFNLVHSERGAVTGATYTDVNAQLPALRLLVVISIVCAVLFLINARFRTWALPVGGVGLLLLTAIIAGGLYPQAIQRLRVAPNERLQERPFIEDHIAATREAFGLDETKVQGFPARADLDAKGLRANADTVNNIRLWSPEILGAQYVAQQRIKQYYEFLDVDVDRYTIDGKVRQVMLSARELDLDGLESGARTWLNEHLVYTHGYGIVASRVNQHTAEGEPDFILKNVPPDATEPALTLKQPQIYYGQAEELPFVVVGSKQKELDFPQGDRFAETVYDGKGGIALKSVLRRAAFAWRFGDVNLMISGAITGESKILFRRHVRDRIEQVAPFLKLDTDPYIAIIDGRATWIVDAYTTSDMYPYVERINLNAVSPLVGVANYIRNAVKFTVDAKDGTITGYAWDEDDPVLKTWMKVYPGIFKPRSEMPKGVLAHVRYPEDLFKVQTERFGSYHITDPDNFYSKEDAWRVAFDASIRATEESAEIRPVPPYYVLMRLPGDKELSFVLVRPFTPTGARQNLTAYMVAHSDPDRYGEIISYVLPKNENIFGPDQIQSRINSDPEISPFVTLQSQRGSKVIFGNLLIVPIERSLLYVQPIYVRGVGSNLPELKRVVAVLGQDVRMGNSLSDALGKIFGGAPSGGGGDDPPPDEQETVAELLARAIAADERAQAALRAGDFAEYGRQQRAMRAALAEAAQRSGAPQASPSPAPS